MKKPLISIIVPIYNVEKYLNKCVNSLINQSYSNIEILLIDDESPDNCPKLCDDFSKKDKRIKVYHKTNGGLSDARNYGISRATGKYIAFCDSDDYVSYDYIEYLYNLISKYNADLSICSYTVVFNNKNNRICGLNEEKQLNNIEALDRLLYSNGIEFSACAKLYKKDLFNDVKFPYGKLYEDAATTYKLLEKSKNIAVGNESKYFYIMRNSSITNSQFTEKNKYLIEATNKMCSDLSKYKILETGCKRRITCSYISTLNKLIVSSNYDKDYAKSIKKQILNNKNIIFDNKVPMRDKAAIIILMLFGIKIYKKIWILYKKKTGRIN